MQKEIQLHLEGNKVMQADRLSQDTVDQAIECIAAVHQPVQRHQSVQTDEISQQHFGNAEDLQYALGSSW
jgi:hypothetical protein